MTYTASESIILVLYFAAFFTGHIFRY